MPDTRTSSLPHLQYHLSSPSSRDYGWIVAGNERVHRVGDQDEFYRALGYTDEDRHAGKLPDEYLWERYTRDGAVKSAKCLQVQIAAYLHKKSGKFKEQFGHAFDTIIGKCTSDDIDSNDALCVDCPCHPRFAY